LDEGPGRCAVILDNEVMTPRPGSPTKLHLFGWGFSKFRCATSANPRRIEIRITVMSRWLLDGWQTVQIQSRVSKTVPAAGASRVVYRTDGLGIRIAQRVMIMMNGWGFAGGKMMHEVSVSPLGCVR